MKVIAKFGRDDLATVYVVEMGKGRLVEFVESLQPPIPREKKWVVIVSTLLGCPAGCPFCDAGINYSGCLDPEEIIFQIDYLVKRRFPSGIVPVDKWKIQFARMGEPSFNMGVLEVLETIRQKYHAPGLIPSISTIAPVSGENFLERLLSLRKRLYPGTFQFQFSLHSTDKNVRSRLIPVKTWDFDRMAEYGEAFFEQGHRKITLNFALTAGVPVDADVLARYFDPDIFLIKVTPLNPTRSVWENGYKPLAFQEAQSGIIIESLREEGYEVLVSIGELEENAIGSNCGQYVSRLRDNIDNPRGIYTYPVEPV